MNDRLTKSDWLAHGLRTLAVEGMSALRVMPMASKLNVSRGSFYWHFRDISDFREQLLQSWLEEATERVIRDIEEVEADMDRLKSLLVRALVSAPRLERDASPWAAEDAIRSWATEDEKVAAVVASVDDRRVTYIAGLLRAAGVGRQKAHSRAVILYWAYLGRGFVMDARHAFIGEAAVDDIVNLIDNAS